jgi:hypothetical protein
VVEGGVLLVSHQTAGAKPIRGVGLGGARVMIIDFFFFRASVFPVYNKRKLPSYSLLRMGNSSSRSRPRSFVDSDFFYLFFYKTIRPD